jgi:hypothetical protein
MSNDVLGRIEMADSLTTSSLPGTTLRSVPIFCRSLNLYIIDTPGVP